MKKGIYLLIQPSDAKLWRLGNRFDNKRKTLALGTYPETGLALARGKRDVARKLMAQDINLGAQRKQDKHERKMSQENTFEAVVRDWMKTKGKDRSRSARRWRRSSRLRWRRWSATDRPKRPDCPNRPFPERQRPAHWAGPDRQKAGEQELPFQPPLTELTIGLLSAWWGAHGTVLPATTFTVTNGIQGAGTSPVNFTASSRMASAMSGVASSKPGRGAIPGRSTSSSMTKHISLTGAR